MNTKKLAILLVVVVGILTFIGIIVLLKLIVNNDVTSNNQDVISQEPGPKLSLKYATYTLDNGWVKLEPEGNYFQVSFPSEFEINVGRSFDKIYPDYEYISFGINNRIYDLVINFNVYLNNFKDIAHALDYILYNDISDLKKLTLGVTPAYKKVYKNDFGQDVIIYFVDNFETKNSRAIQISVFSESGAISREELKLADQILNTFVIDD